MEHITSCIIPLLFALFGLSCLISKKDTLPSFTDGARSGFHSAISLLPSLVLLMTAVSMFSASGATDAIASLLSPIMTKLGVPAELLPLIILRPVSGSGSAALLSEILNEHGPDSFVGRCASVLTASSDTLIYVVTVYMASAGIKRIRHTMLAGATVMILGIFLSCFFVRVLLY